MHRFKIFLLSFAFAYNGGLLVILNDISIHQVQLILAIGALIINIFKIKNNVKMLLYSKLSILLLLIFSFIYYICIDNKVPIYSAYKVDIFFWNVAIILISTLVVNNKKELYLLIIISNIQIASSILIDFVQNNFNFFLLREEYIVTGRLLGAYILSYFLFLKNQIKKKQIKILSRLITVVLMFLLFLSGARAPILVLIILVGYKMVINKKMFVKLLYFFGVIFIYLIIANTNILLFEGEYSYLNRIFGVVTSNVSLDEFSNGRFELIDIILNNDIDFLFGNGVGSTAWMLARSDIRIYPHNLIIELVVEVGVVGLLIFTLLIIILYNRSISILKNRNEDLLKTYIGYFLSFSILTALFSLEFPNQFLLFQSIAFLFIINSSFASKNSVKKLAKELI